jgi:hypothetical protein
MMRCPACGHEERIGTVCSRCATPLLEAEQPASTHPPEKPVTPPPPAPPQEGKHRPRPLHDLDLTLPELDLQPLTSSEPQPQNKQGEEIPSFKVTDYRLRSEPKAAPLEPALKPETSPETGPSSEPKPARPLDFSSFVFSLGATALIALGEAHLPGLPSEQGSGRPVDMAQARELIDLLGLLEAKTKGNLTPEESELLQQTLYNLRIKFVQALKQKP